MDEQRAQRTLVKSPPELWAEVSDVDALAARLGEFGEIRITRTEPETTVAWEGDRARGTVELEPAGWGTKVTLTAAVADTHEEPEAAVAPAPPSPAPASEPEPVAGAPAPRRGFFARLFGRRRAAEATTPIEAATAETAEMLEVAPPRAEPLHHDRAQAILCAVLDDLGSAHHRPFSR
jgi:hypothetical protein